MSLSFTYNLGEVICLERLRILRNERGVRQSDIAEHLGISRTAYIKYEHGDSEPSLENLAKIADYYGVTVDFVIGKSNSRTGAIPKGVLIPVLGDVQAGLPMEAVENIIDYEEIPESMARSGEYFGLRIRGASMEPRFTEGDVVIVRKQSTIETGEIGVVLVNGDSATIKKIKRSAAGITLIPTNPAFEPMFYDNEEIRDLPVTIVGKVVELRAKF